MTSRSESERLREVFSEAALDLTPSPVPLAEIQKAGAARHRRRTAALAAGCVLVLLPAGAAAVHYSASPGASSVRPAAPPPTVAPRSSPAVPPTREPADSGPRVVQPGERIRAAPGMRLWLTPEGLHWSAPGGPSDAIDGTLDPAASRMAFRATAAHGHRLLFGAFRDAAGAARAEITTDRGTITGQLLRLPGDPGWGAWYATTEVTEQDRTGPEEPAGTASTHPADPDVSAPARRITLYDTHGKVVAELVLEPGGVPPATPLHR